MRVAILSAAAAFVVLAPDAFAQTETHQGYTGACAPAGTPPSLSSSAASGEHRPRQGRRGP
jgi:hypothetical protein